MSIDYTKLPRLAELCEQISASKYLTASFEVNHHGGPVFELLVYSWSEALVATSYRMRSKRVTKGERGYTLDEMLATLERIQTGEIDVLQEIAA